MKKISWVIVWALLPATALLAYTSSQRPAALPPEVWMALTLLGSFAFAYVAARRPRQPRLRSRQEN